MKQFSAPISNYRGGPLDCAGTTALFPIANRETVRLSCCSNFHDALFHLSRLLPDLRTSYLELSRPLRSPVASRYATKNTLRPGKDTLFRKKTRYFLYPPGGVRHCVSPSPLRFHFALFAVKFVSGSFCFALFPVFSAFFRIFPLFSGPPSPGGTPDFQPSTVNI